MAAVRDVMATKLHSVGPSDTVGEAVTVMAQHRVGSVLVMEGDELIGIFTERDTVRALSQSHDAARHEIESWMTRHPKTVTPDVDSEQALKTMLDSGFRHLPVVDDGKVLVIVFGLSQLGGLAAAASIPKVIQAIIDGPITHHRLTTLVQMAGLLLLIAALEFVLIVMRRHFAGVASLSMETDLRNDFYAHLQSLQVSFHDNWQSGQLLSRAIADISTVRRFVGFGLIWFAQIFITFAVVLVLMLLLDWQLALVVVAFMVPIAFFSTIFHKKYKVIARRLQDMSG